VLWTDLRACMMDGVQHLLLVSTSQRGGPLAPNVPTSSMFKYQLHCLIHDSCWIARMRLASSPLQRRKRQVRSIAENQNLTWSRRKRADRRAGLIREGRYCS